MLGKSFKSLKWYAKQRNNARESRTIAGNIGSIRRKKQVLNAMVMNVLSRRKNAQMQLYSILRRKQRVFDGLRNVTTRQA